MDPDPKFPFKSDPDPDTDPKKIISDPQHCQVGDGMFSEEKVSAGSVTVQESCGSTRPTRKTGAVSSPLERFQQGYPYQPSKIHGMLLV